MTDKQLDRAELRADAGFAALLVWAACMAMTLTALWLVRGL